LSLTVIRPALVLTSALALASCATTAPQSAAAPPSLDDLARDYLAVQLAIGEKDPGYVDAYYGPAELKAKAEAEDAGMTLPMLQARVVALDATLAAIETVPGSEDAGRVRYLRAILSAAKVRLRMLRGETIPFQDEAEGLFGVRPEMIDLTTLDPVIEEIDALVPGEGPLNLRLNAYRDKFVIPAEKLRPVIDAAVAECKARTLAHIALPEGERFDLSLVTDKPWGGFNYYQGDYHSVIEINTDLPTRLDRAVDVGCHEAYPGHHVYSTLIERDRVNGMGQIEFTLLPLYSPRAIVSEGSAEYGVKMAFPGDDQMTFERDVLAPLAGIDASEIEDYYALRKATSDLGDAYYTIAAGYLDQTMTREEVIEALMKYQLASRERAEGSLGFLDTYRSYVVNYGMGYDLVGDYVDQAGEGETPASRAARWERFTGILANPTLPSDLIVEE